MPVGVRTTLTNGAIQMQAILFGEENEPPIVAEAEAETPEAVAVAVFAQLAVA